MADRDPHVEAIYRYPVKGLSPERLARAALAAGETVPADRIYAIENGPSGFDPAMPRHLAKNHFLMLMRNERLAALRATFDPETHHLAIGHEGRPVAAGDLRRPEGRQGIENFFAAFCADELRGPPRILSAAGHSFSDVSKKVVSIINLSTVARVEDAVGFPVDPLRFRGNIHVGGWPAWSEFDLLGKTVAIGRAKLKIIKRIRRCAATNVDPFTGLRDLRIPETLQRSFGHMDCGVYAEVIEGGMIAPGDSVIDPTPRLM